jgi:hypothetical protein
MNHIVQRIALVVELREIPNPHLGESLGADEGDELSSESGKEPVLVKRIVHDQTLSLFLLAELPSHTSVSHRDSQAL